MAQQGCTATGRRLPARVAVDGGQAHRDRRMARSAPPAKGDGRPGCPNNRWTIPNRKTVDRQLVLTALRTLSTEQREVLFEVYFRDASVAE